MITIFNRKELLITFSMNEQADAREVLRNHKIPYIIKTINRGSPSPFSSGTRARTGSFGMNMDAAYEYIIYVKKQDYEYARTLI